VHCRSFALQLQRHKPDIEQAGGSLVMIGQATPRHAAAFRRKYAPDVRILADEKRKTYKLVGATRAGVTGLFKPEVVLKGIARGASAGTVQGRPIGDVAQLGGTVIVTPGGKIPWSHMSRDAGDNASIAEILSALEEAA
jgi:hypothetical protein